MRGLSGPALGGAFDQRQVAIGFSYGGMRPRDDDLRIARCARSSLPCIGDTPSEMRTLEEREQAGAGACGLDLNR